VAASRVHTETSGVTQGNATRLLLPRRPPRLPGLGHQAVGALPEEPGAEDDGERRVTHLGGSALLVGRWPAGGGDPTRHRRPSRSRTTPPTTASATTSAIMAHAR